MSKQVHAYDVKKVEDGENKGSKRAVIARENGWSVVGLFKWLRLNFHRSVRYDKKEYLDDIRKKSDCIKDRVFTRSVPNLNSLEVLVDILTGKFSISGKDHNINQNDNGNFDLTFWSGGRKFRVDVWEDKK